MRSRFVVLALAVFAAPADAQDSSGPGRQGRVHSVAGVVVDSLRRRPLAGAEIVLAGTAVAAVSDSLGRFTLDSIAPGRYSVAFFHPLLDSISVAAAPRTLSVPLADGKGILLAIPSASTLVRGICQVDQAAGRSLLVGRVTDPDTGTPVPGASVFVTWSEYEVSKKKGIDRTPRVVQGGTDMTGTYRVCGLPVEIDAVVHATRDSSSTSPVAISSRSGGLIIRDLTLAVPELSAGKRASITGTVKTADGIPIAGATVATPEFARTATTDSSGTFTLAGAPLGTRNVIVRRLGFVPARIPVDLTSRETHRLDVVMSEQATVIDPTYVIARRERALARVGFTLRRERGVGQFRTRQDFERQNPTYLTDIIGTIRGVRIDYTEGKRVIRGAGAGAECAHLVVDGVHRGSLVEGDMDDAVVPQHISALEVYSGSEVPPQFENPLARGCLTIVIWTRTSAQDLSK
ncbi:MAG: carboxypeptidase regulatory-like domain-containing protein [Gemmatimonadaceae bacterium]